MLCITLAAWLVALGGAPAAKVWEAPLVLPTYELGAADPNPALGGGERRPIYPYPMLDSLTSRRIEKSYRAVYLENQYLRVTVLPELGGRVYAIFDKTAGRDALYTNHVVKYSLIGIRGAWISGGIEWNFPDGHTATTVSPVDYAMRTDADGSAVVVVGDTERVQRMQWAVELRLRPGMRVLEAQVTLNNRREVPGRYWYWANAAGRAAEDLRFVYPMREAYPHTFWPVFTFPKWNGLDLGTYRDVPNPLSLFARNSKRDFLGVYYEKSDWGMVHVADHREVAGKKTWTWGNDEAGMTWIDKLTERDGQYVEFQAGRFETQMEHEFIEPHRVERFTEYWFPVQRLGGAFVEANRNGALRVAREGGDVQVSVDVNAVYENATVTVGATTRKATLRPGEPFNATFAAPAGEVVEVRVASQAGEEVIRYRTDTPLDGNAEFRAAVRPETDPKVEHSAEQLYLEGRSADKKSLEEPTRKAYAGALERDPGYAPALVGLGLSYYRSGEYAKAEEYLQRALRRNPDAAEAHYYLGLVKRAQRQWAAAEDQFVWAVRAGYREAAARYELGEMALEQGKTNQALNQLSRCIALNEKDLKARVLMAIAERLAGKQQAAERRIEGVLKEMPIDYLALAESGHGRAELWRLLGREPDAILELAFDYTAAGRRTEARGILEEGIQRGVTHPMLHYTLGALYAAAGEPERELEQYRQGQRGDMAYVFPHRVEEIAVLQRALAANPGDARAAYYLGNALASKERTAEALEMWRKAVQLEPSNAVAHRNIGRLLAVSGGNREEAIAAYQRAVEQAPTEVHLQVELARLLPAGRRIKMLEGAREQVRGHAAALEALAQAYVDGGRFAAAVRLLETTLATSGEGDIGLLGVYRKAHEGVAAEYQRAGQHEKAAAEFVKATGYPRNLGYARPAYDYQGRLYVAAARELDAAGKKEEAARWWRRAAEEPLSSPADPAEPSPDQVQYKTAAVEELRRAR